MSVQYDRWDVGGVGGGGPADDVGRRPQCRSPTRPERPTREWRRRYTPSSVAQPAGTSSRSPCHPQRRRPSTMVITCSCGPVTGGQQHVPLVRTHQERQHRGGCPQVVRPAGSRSRVRIRAITGSANWVNANPRYSTSAGTVAGASSTHAADSANRFVARPVRSRSATSRRPAPVVGPFQPHPVGQVRRAELDHLIRRSCRRGRRGRGRARSRPCGAGRAGRSSTRWRRAA